MTYYFHDFKDSRDCPGIIGTEGYSGSTRWRCWLGFICYSFCFRHFPFIHRSQASVPCANITSSQITSFDYELISLTTTSMKDTWNVTPILHTKN